MFNFSEHFKATKSIIDLGHYNDPSWVKETLNSIKELKKNLPKNTNAYSIAENLNQKILCFSILQEIHKALNL